MQEQISKPKSVFGTVSAPASTGTTQNLVAKATEIGSKIRVIHGSNDSYFPVAGKTVGEVRKGLKTMLNLPETAEAEVDGKRVSDEFVLVPGQSIEFSKESGTKGRL